MITREGDHEQAKALVHAAIGAAAVTCLTYNAIALSERPKPHLLVNVVVYSLLAWFEWGNVRTHLRSAQ